MKPGLKRQTADLKEALREQNMYMNDLIAFLWCLVDKHGTPVELDDNTLGPKRCIVEWELAKTFDLEKCNVDIMKTTQGFLLTAERSVLWKPQE